MPCAAKTTTFELPLICDAFHRIKHGPQVYDDFRGLFSLVLIALNFRFCLCVTDLSGPCHGRIQFNNLKKRLAQ
jgi:hypothetical protein